MVTKNNITILFIIASIFISCNFSNNENLLIELKKDLDSLKEIYAPDTRIALWNIYIINNKKIELTVEVDNKKAKTDLLRTMEEKYPNVNIKVNLLPEDVTNSMALVNNSVSSIRQSGNHRAEIVNQVLLGRNVKILKEEKEWCLIQTPNKYLGWINFDDIVKIDSKKVNEYKISKKIIYNEQYGFSYSKPDSKSQVVTDLVIGCILPIIEEENKFYKVKYPDNRIAYVKKDEVLDFNEIVNKTPKGDALVETAKKFNGIPYLWGGSSSKAIDCSGFSSIIYFLNGIVLQRDASQQIQYGKVISSKYKFDELKKGDLLFFGRNATDSLPEKVTHVAMYIGDSEFIHASGKVRINSMDSSRENFAPEYVNSFIRTVRIIGEENGVTIQKIKDNNFYKNIISE